MDKAGIDALLVTSLPNVFYLSGFAILPGSTAALVVIGDDSYILVDPRFSIQARAECKEARVSDYFGISLTMAAVNLIDELKPGRVGFESEHLTVSSYRELRKTVHKGIKLRSTCGLVEKLRRVKDEHEIALIRKACQIADAAFEAVFFHIKPGMTEKEVALLIDTTLRRLGADKEAFETIAASGPNSACPHAIPTDTVLRRGQLLKLDFGARYRSYNSDITRTICLGRPTAKQREVYGIVLEAQRLAIDAIAPGKSGKEIDAVARDYIASKGYGDNFGHGLGHALGIEFHDGPAFSKTSDLILEPGNVLTVEPGIYIEGWGGIRIEDDVLVTDTGADVITTAVRKL